MLVLTQVNLCECLRGTLPCEGHTKQENTSFYMGNKWGYPNGNLLLFLR